MKKKFLIFSVLIGLFVSCNNEVNKNYDFKMSFEQGNVVFTCKGKMPEAFTNLYNYVVTEFFPTSEYQPCGVEIEAYPSDNVQDPNYTCELWIAVEKK